MPDIIQIDRFPPPDTATAFSAFGKPCVSLKHAAPQAPDAPDAPPAMFAWDIVAGADVVGRVCLDFEAAEFDRTLARYCPAVRIAVDLPFRGRGFATEALRQFMEELQACHFTRPLLAAHDAEDVAGAQVLSNAGFIHTGCRSRSGNGKPVRHMIRLL